jgi:hypothetical protein
LKALDHIASLPTSGSFIRPTNAISWGRSLFSALHEKYVDQIPIDNNQEFLLLGSSNASINVEAVGLDKIRRRLSDLSTLRVVGLEKAGISGLLNKSVASAVPSQYFL